MSHEYKLPDGERVTLPLPHLSNSQIDMYRRCPRQYWYRYIEGLKEAPSFTLAHGLSGHHALEYNNIFKIGLGEDAPTHEVIEKMNDDWSGRVKEAAGEMMIVDPEKKFLRKARDSDVDRSRKTLGDLLALYMEEDAPSINPVGAEEEHRVEIAGIPILAYTDLRTTNRIVDYKFGLTRATRYGRAGAADSALQLTLYSILTGLDRVGYMVFLPGQKLKTKAHAPEVRKINANRTDDQRFAAEYIVADTAKAISAGSFPICGDDNFLCSPNYCGFWHRCKGRLAKGKAPLIGEPKVREPLARAEKNPPPPPKPE